MQHGKPATQQAKYPLLEKYASPSAKSMLNQTNFADANKLEKALGLAEAYLDKNYLGVPEICVTAHQDREFAGWHPYAIQITDYPKKARFKILADLHTALNGLDVLVEMV